MTLPKPIDIIEEADDLSLDSLSRELSRRNMHSPQDLRGRLVILDQDGGLFCLGENTLIFISGDEEQGILCARDLGETKEISMTEELPVHILEEALEYIFECWGNRKCDLKRWVERRMKDEPAET